MAKSQDVPRLPDAGLGVESALSLRPCARTGPPWHAQAPDDVLRAFATTAHGLSPERAAELAREHGANVLAPAPPLRPWLLFAGQFRGLLIWLLFGAALLSVAFRAWGDALAILTILLLDAGIGFWQELHA